MQREHCDYMLDLALCSCPAVHTVGIKKEEPVCWDACMWMLEDSMGVKYTCDGKELSACQSGCMFPCFWETLDTQCVQ